jgi:hypothetical protein
MRTIHKYFGLMAAILVILVSITGVLLIHKKSLGLNKVSIRVNGYTSPKTVDAFDVLLTKNGLTIIASKQGVYIKEEGAWKVVIPSLVKRLYEHDNYYYACSKEGLYSSKDGRSWKRLFSGQEVKAIRFDGNELIIATTKGIYKGNQDNDQWKEMLTFSDKPLDVRNFSIAEEVIILAAKEGILISEHGKKLRPDYLPLDKKVAQTIDLQKLITDIHTGEFFGSYFYVVMDALAIGLIALSVTGVYIWWRHRKKLRKEN